MPGSTKDIVATAAEAQCLTGTAIPIRDLASIVALAAMFPPEMEKRPRRREWGP